MLQKAFAVAAIGKRNIQNLGIFQRLLHAVAQHLIAALGFDNCERRAPVGRGQNIVGLFLFATARVFAAHGNPSVSKAIFHKNLFFCPACRFNGGGDMAQFHVFFAVYGLAHEAFSNISISANSASSLAAICCCSVRGGAATKMRFIFSWFILGWAVPVTYGYKSVALM